MESRCGSMAFEQRRARDVFACFVCPAIALSRRQCSIRIDRASVSALPYDLSDASSRVVIATGNQKLLVLTWCSCLGT
jgi:hypothetical protein